MAVSSHRIHTIHGAFGAPSCFAPSMPLAINPAQASSFNRIPNVCVPRSRPFRAVPGATSPASASLSRTAPASSTAPSIIGTSLSSAAGSRPRRTSLSFTGPAPTRRAPPPPPPVFAERTAPALAASSPAVVQIPTIEDPFADAFEEPLQPVLVVSAPARTRVASYTIPPASNGGGSAMMASSLRTPPGLAPAAAPSITSVKDTRGRLVASVLLSRGSGRPLGVYLRRRLSGEQQGYVKSGLSQLVAAAA
ncbi:hypothetical protein C8Q79DRAFT_955650 [Trametes meyenii]|nr:hypothetical protein C8Q79DRAFT_955650 [Trametes meyenii]